MMKEFSAEDITIVLTDAENNVTHRVVDGAFQPVEPAMTTAEEFREQLLKTAMDELKSKATQVIDDVMGDLYCAYLPHVETDTESNIGTRVDGVIRNLIAGNIRKVSESMVSVSDGYEREHYISINSYDGMVGPLCKLMGAEIENARIKELEALVESLKSSLSEAWRQ